LPDPQLAPSTAKSGKNRIRKTEINFKGRPQKFFGSFFVSQILGWALMSPGEALQRGYGLAGASVGSSVRRAFFAMQNDCRSLLVKKPGT
jgi:hypothetical protein